MLNRINLLIIIYNIFLALFFIVLIPLASKATELNGLWIGATSQGLELSFTVNNGTVSPFNIDILITDSFREIDNTIKAEIEIIDQNFHYSSSDSASTSELSGNFESSISAKGSYIYFDKQYNSTENVNWEAKLQGNNQPVSPNNNESDSGGCFVNSIIFLLNY